MISLKKLTKENKLTLVAFISLAVAVLSVFTTVISYTNQLGEHRTFAIFDFLAEDSNGFGRFVLNEYDGPILMKIGPEFIITFVIIAVLAIACAFVGLFMISNQKGNNAAFVLTLIGLIGTMAPSVILLIFVVFFGGYYDGTIHCGIYPIVSPIAMIICIFAATSMHRMNLKYKAKLKAAEGLIFKGPDLGRN